ncbi:hypothetical protein STENM327S_03024 [Streptomyces tendae]
MDGGEDLGPSDVARGGQVSQVAAQFDVGMWVWEPGMA